MVIVKMLIQLKGIWVWCCEWVRIWVGCFVLSQIFFIDIFEGFDIFKNQILLSDNLDQDVY